MLNIRLLMMIVSEMPTIGEAGLQLPRKGSSQCQCPLPSVTVAGHPFYASLRTLPRASVFGA